MRNSWRRDCRFTPAFGRSGSERLTQCRQCGHQLLEETITDLICLHLKTRNPAQVFTRTFNKREEGVVGADWEWWFTNASRSQWLGFRVQAKVLDLASCRYLHLHYRQKDGTYQLDRLVASARGAGATPLYCLYSQWVGSPSPPVRCLTYGPATESYGCALLPIMAVGRLRTASAADSLAAVLPDTVPWHCLVCCGGYSQGSLPQRAWAFAKATGLVPADDTGGLRDSPPRYVTALLTDSATEAPDEYLQTITVFQDGGTAFYDKPAVK